MILTIELLKENNIYQREIDYIVSKKLIGKDVIKVLNYLIDDNKLELVNTIITGVMTQKQCVKYAIYAAKNCIDLIEDENLKVFSKMAIDEGEKFGTEFFSKDNALKAHLFINDFLERNVFKNKGFNCALIATYSIWDAISATIYPHSAAKSATDSVFA